MKRNLTHGFTLVEMLTVMAIIAILAGIVLNIHGFVNSKAAQARAKGEIEAISSACETYKSDNGSYPRLPDPTEGKVPGPPPQLTQAAPPLNPMQMGNPTSTKYKDASQYLYGQLSGDLNFNGIRDNATINGTTAI